MKLTYDYTVHGFSGGRMLFHRESGEWDFFSLEKGLDLDTPNKEVKMIVIDKTCDTVTFRMQYRRNEKCVTVSASGEEHFSDEANAYGFSFVFRIRD